MPVVAQREQGLPALDGDGLLMGEVRHATGNLLHRLRYWTSLLEGEPLGGPAAQAVTEIRSSLDGLQQLIARTMELLRPSTVRCIAIPTDDIARAIAIRFGFECAVTAALNGAEASRVLVDPALLDRALTILAEVFAPRLDGQDDGFVIGSDRSPDTNASLTIQMKAKPRASAESDPYASVHHDVNLALARKLLAETGCSCAAHESDGVFQLAIALPLDEAIASDLSIGSR